MSSISPSDQSQIQAVESALGQYIKQAESGNPNVKDLSSIQQQISSLLNNPNIPESVQQSLQAASNQLKQAQSGGDIGNVYSAKMQVDSVLGAGETEHLGGGPGEEKLGGGSLGGGSEEQ